MGTLLLLTLLLVIWILVSSIIVSVFSKFNFYKKLEITYKLKIPQKFNERKSPIYVLSESVWGDSELFIKKWVHRYYEPEIYQLISIMVIYPIRILRYGYQFEDSVFLCLKKDVEMIEGTLEENYERIWGEQNKEHQEELRIKNNQNKMIENLNKTFFENIE
jgi:hypothetical protein